MAVVARGRQKKTLGSRLMEIPRELWRNAGLYVMFIPAVVLLFCFNYLPLFGLSMVFKEFDYGLGIFGSPLANPWYQNFVFLFQNEGTLRAVQNTLITNVMFIIGGTIGAVALAILLNEVLHNTYKRFIQSFSLLPYFISVIIINVFAYQILSYDNGVLNRVLLSLGIEKINWYGEPKYWRWIMLIIHMWKNVGYNGVIYLATITSIDMGYYEAADIDGASRWQKIWKITIPMLVPTILTLSLLALGRIMSSDFGFFYAIIGDNPLLYPTVDVLDTFIYRNLRKLGDVSMSSAASFIQSIISGILLVAANGFARKYNPEAALF